MKIGLFDGNVMSYGLKNARLVHFPRPWWRCSKVGLIISLKGLWMMSISISRFGINN